MIDRLLHRLGLRKSDPRPSFVAVNSDVEWTSWELQKELFRLFEEYDIEVAFSYWFFCNPSSTWRFFENDGSLTPEAEEAFEFAKQGRLDTLHAFGGRRHSGGCDYRMEKVGEAYEEFRRRGIPIRIFTNHGGDADNQNVGGDWATHHQGDVPGADFYHLDRTLSEGVRFFWCDPDYQVERPFLKASAGDEDSLFLVDQVRDGSKILRFRRFMGSLDSGCCLSNFEQQVDQLLKNRTTGYGIIYQHLGVMRNDDGTPRAATMEEVQKFVPPALEKLQKAQEKGHVTSLTTDRLLRRAFVDATGPWALNQSEEGDFWALEAKATLNGVEQQLDWDDFRDVDREIFGDLPVRLNGEQRRMPI